MIIFLQCKSEILLKKLQRVVKTLSCSHSLLASYELNNKKKQRHQLVRPKSTFFHHDLEFYAKC